jgi:hypothetical protein
MKGLPKVWSDDANTSADITTFCICVSLVPDLVASLSIYTQGVSGEMQRVHYAAIYAFSHQHVNMRVIHIGRYLVMVSTQILDQHQWTAYQTFR